MDSSRLFSGTLVENNPKSRTIFQNQSSYALKSKPFYFLIRSKFKKLETGIIRCYLEKKGVLY
jgi:hypothetical protein